MQDIKSESTEEQEDQEQIVLSADFISAKITPSKIHT